MGQFGMGQMVPRTEDPRLLRGEGQYTADLVLPNMAHAAVLRSPHAHARIDRLDTGRARQAPGVLAVYTADDLAADKLGTTVCRLPRKRPDGGPMYQNPHPALARGQVRYVGDPVAFVVAETLAQARDAAELIDVDYTPLPSVVDVAEAVAPGAAPVWPDCPDNVSNVFEQGDKAKVDAAFAQAAHVVRHRFVISRLVPAPMEPRACIGEYDRRQGRFTLYAPIHNGHLVRQMLTNDVFKVPETRLRILAGDIGGAFGSKGITSHENILALYAARKLGRPVKWVADRSEGFMSDEHARDNVSDAELALDKDGNFLALRVKTLCNIGAYLTNDRNLFATFGNVGTLAGVYKTPAIHVAVYSVFTNTVATTTYRGAGRPEASYVIEGMVDRAARALGMDRVALRRRNMIPAAAMPFKTGLVFVYDSGEFEKIMDEALHRADYAGFEARRAAAKARGRLRGIGVANPIERAGAPPGPETAEIRFDPSGGVTLIVGTKSQGQGHDTMYKIILSHTLGVDSDDVMLLEGDSDNVAYGTGTFGSRSAIVGGSAAWAAANKIIDKGRKIAAHILEAADTDIAFERGTFTVAGTDRKISLTDVAKAAYRPGALPKGMEPGLFETGVWEPDSQTFPNGCHVCEVEIDPDTGRLEIVRYVVVDDVGTVINELTLEGQVHGGVVQGVGQAVMECITYDRASGQLVTGSFMDYAMPRADDFCAIEVESHPVPTRTNPLGVKGAGEAGTVGALPVIASAVLDAVAPLGITELEMPLTPEALWRAMLAADRSFTKS